MAEAADDDATFFSELLALLEDADASADAPVDAPAAATPTVSDWPPRLKHMLRQGVGRSGPKELQALRAEAQSLGRTLEQLRGGRPPGELAARQLAYAERRKRQRAERECQALREAVYRHTQFVRGLDTLFYLRPHFSLRLNLCRFLHRHVRLPRDRSSRWGDFDPVSHDARLQSAMDVLCRETAAMSLASPQTPVFHCEPVDDVDCHSVTSTGVYTVDTDDLGAAVRGACVAVRDIVTLCPLGHALVVESDIVDDASVARNILYRVMGVRHRNLDSGAEVLLESHVVTSYKIASDHAVVLWDFVDDDQLHPTPDATNITREITGACLIRRERCDDGAERTVLRSLCTKRYRFHGCDVPERYGCVTEQSMYANEQLFRAIVADQVAAETQLLAQAHAQTQAARRREYAATPAVENGACPCRLG